MDKKIWRTAIVLSAGNGSRMSWKISKQYMELDGKPIICHTLACFQQSVHVDDIVMVAAPGTLDYCQSEIVEKYGFSKVKYIVEGGPSRCDSVYEGLKACPHADFVYIHDGVRPFVTEEILKRNIECAMTFGCAITGMPSKDTIKIVSGNHQVLDTPSRESVWNAQTPQTFEYKLIRQAHDLVRTVLEDTSMLTDDAMVLERFGKAPVYMCEGSYDNIKITVPGDLVIAEELIEKNRLWAKEKQKKMNTAPGGEKKAQTQD